MANVNLQRTSWGYGELDQRMLGRTDLPTYRQGLVKMENWLPAKSGAAVMRGGMEQVKAIPTTFEADYLIPLRGGASPLLGLYNSTDQTFRVLKSDGSWVGTEASPAEVTLFQSCTFTERDTDASEPYTWEPSDSAEKAAIDAFYDVVASYVAPPNANCFTIKLTVGANTQTFSMDGGDAKLERVNTATGVGAKLTLTIANPRLDSHQIDPVIAGNLTRYLAGVTLQRAEVSPASTATTVTLDIDDTKDGVGGSGDDITAWETNGTVTVSLNDEAGVAPLWAVEPNVAYNETTVRIFRPNSDVKCYKITDTTITEDLHDGTGADLVGDVTGGKHSSHGAYFEQRIIYGGGKDHRQEIVGSRSPDPDTGDRRYGAWEQRDFTTVAVADVVTQQFTMAAVDYSTTLWGGGHMQLSPANTSDARRVDTAFTFNGALRYFSSIILGNNSNYAYGEEIWGISFGSGDTIANESSGGTPPNNGLSTDGTGLSNLSDAFETTAKVYLTHGTDDELKIDLGARPTDAQAPNANSPNLSAARPYLRTTGTGTGTLLAVGASLYKLHKYNNSDNLAAKLFNSEQTEVTTFLQKMLALDPRPQASAFTVKFEMGTTESTTTRTVNSDNAFHWVIDTGTTFAEVRWLQAYSGVLVVGTSAGVALCKFLNPDDPPEIRWHSAQSVARKPPLSTPLGILAVSADKTSVYEVVKKRELTAYSEDRFRIDKIHTIAWQQQPQQRLWVVTEAGKIHVLTIQEENAVNGWAQITHQHAGTCTGVVVTPGDDADDTVWFLMKYGSQSYVEKYHEATANLHSNRVFMDSAVKRKVGYQTISMATSEIDVGSFEGAQHIQVSPIVGDIDNKLSAMFVGSAAVRYLHHVMMKDEDGSVTRQASINFEEVFGETSQQKDMGSAFEAGGIVTVRHTAPLTGTVLSVDIPFSATDDTADPYDWTEAQLGGVGAGGGSDLVEAFVDAISALYPNGDDVPGSANFEIEVKLEDQKIAIPDNMVNVSGKKLIVTSALAAGNISETTQYEIHDSPATSVIDTNFAYGQEVWVGFQVIADMELPAISQSISQRVAGSWLGQPARIPWTVAGVEKAHSVKIGPTYDKLVEYCADTTTLSFTISMTQTTDNSEPYVWTTGGFDEAEVVAWFNAVRALNADADGAYGGNRFTQTLVSGGVTQTITAHAWDLDASSIDLVFPYRPANQIHSTIAGGATRFSAGTQVTNLGQVTLMFDVGGGSGATAGHDLSSDFESSGTLTLTYTHPAPLVTGHERRPLPTNVTTSSPVVIRKDTPSPCTMTYLVVEATTG